MTTATKSTRTKYRGPRRVGAALPADLKRAFRGRGLADGQIVAAWPAIVGPELAEQCCPERLGPDGTLRLRVAGAAALAIQHLAPQILERVATYFGFRAAQRLVLVQGPLPARKRSARKPPRALDPAEEKALADVCAGVDDPDLRAALERLGRAVVGHNSA